MKENTFTQARWRVLRFLLSENCFSERGHQVTDNTVVKIVSREFSDRDRKAVARAISQLIHRALVCAKKKHYGLHLWLNHARINEIKEVLSKPPG